MLLLHQFTTHNHFYFWRIGLLHVHDLEWNIKKKVNIQPLIYRSIRKAEVQFLLVFCKPFKINWLRDFSALLQNHKKLWKRNQILFLYWNRSSWVCRLNLLPADSGDPSGARRSVHQKCSRACWYESWEPSAELNNVSHFFFFSLHTDSPHENKKEKSDTNNLGVVSSHSPSAKQSRTGWVLGRWRVTSACPGRLTLLGSGSTLTKQAAAAAVGACPSHT